VVRDGEEVVWFAAADQAEAVGTARLEAARAGAVLIYVQVAYTYCLFFLKIKIKKRACVSCVLL
jgi:hypothetical protein